MHPMHPMHSSGERSPPAALQSLLLGSQRKSGEKKKKKMKQQYLTKISNQDKRRLYLLVFLAAVVITSKTSFIINVGKMLVACFFFACFSLVSMILVASLIECYLIILKKFKAFLFVLKDVILMKFRSVERGFSLVKKTIIRIFFSLKNAIIKAGKYCNTILLLAIKKFLQFFTDIKSFFSCLIENQKLIEWFTRAKPFFYPPYVVTLAGLTLQKPAVILYYGRQIIEIYSTCWSGVFGHCLGLVCGVIIVLFYLFLGVLYIKYGVEQVKHGNTWDKLLCLVRRISRVTLGMLALCFICENGGIVIMWNKDWDILYGMLVCWLTGWVLPMPSVSMTMLPMLQTNGSFDQPVTSQAVVARPLADRPVSMPLPFDESVASQAGVGRPRAGVTVLMKVDKSLAGVKVSFVVEESLASQAGVGRPPAAMPLPERSVASQAVVASVPLPELPEQPVAVASDAHRPYAVAMPRPPGIYINYNGVEIPWHPNSTHLLSMAHSHPLIPGQTGIGMPPIWQDPLPHQITYSYDRELPFINSSEILIPVDGRELGFLEEYRIGLIEHQNSFNKPLRKAVLLVRDALKLQVAEEADLVYDATVLKRAAFKAFSDEWSVVQSHDELTQAFARKEWLEMEMSRLGPQIRHFQQCLNSHHPVLLSLYQEYQDKQNMWSNLMQEHPDLKDGSSLLRLSQELNRLRGKSNVSWFNYNQFVRATLEGLVDLTRLARAEDMRRIESIYYPTLHDRYPSPTIDVQRQPLQTWLTKWQWGVMRQHELNKAIGAGRFSYLISLWRFYGMNNRHALEEVIRGQQP